MFGLAAVRDFRPPVSDSPTTSAVFLSYASQDVAAAQRICDSLRADGVDVWLDQEGGSNTATHGTQKSAA